MKYTGNQNYQLFQSVNMKLEHISVIPTFGPEQIGRIFFVPGLGIVAGVESGFVVLSEGGSGSTNGICVYTFKYWCFNTRSVEISCYDSLGNDTKIYPASTGKLDSIEILSSVAISSGHVRVIPKINGAVVSDMVLDLDPTHVRRNFYSSIEDHDFVLGSYLEASIVGDALSEPLESNITVNLTIKT